MVSLSEEQRDDLERFSRSPHSGGASVASLARSDRSEASVLFLRPD